MINPAITPIANLTNKMEAIVCKGTASESKIGSISSEVER